MHEQLEEYLGALARDDCYRVDAVLKESPHEVTERVFFVGANGAEQGPFIRKRLDAGSGMGSAYRRLWQAQQKGRRFAHIPHLVDCYATQDAFVVVMEHVVGETLAEAVYRCNPSPELARSLFPSVCDAVIELHERFDPPMIHRDLKPSNIMVGNGEATVIDLGIAREYDDGASADTHRFGTRSYAPPEQFGYGQTDVRSDVYALGMILYYCLTEKTPDPAIAREGFADEAVPEALRPVLARATAFDPAGRYASVRELRDAYLAALASGPDGAGAPAVAADATQPSPSPAQTACAHVPKAPHAPGAPAAKRTRSSTSTWPGRLWNAFLTTTWLLFAAVTTTMILEPAPVFAEYPAWARPVAGYGVFAVASGLLCWLLADKRRMRSRLPRFARLDTVWAKVFCALLAIAIIFTTVGIAEFAA